MSRWIPISSNDSKGCGEQGGRFGKSPLSRRILFPVLMGLYIGFISGCAGFPAGNDSSDHAEAGESPWLVRGRALGAVPDESSDLDPIGGEADVSNDVTPEVDVSYFVTDHVAFETILGTSRHSVDADQTAAGDIDVGEVSLIPATVTTQYHFSPDRTFAPYVGAGVHYSLFYDEDPPQSGGGAGITEVNYDNAAGWALQAGADFDIGPPAWALNVDVKKIFLQTDVDISSGAGPVQAEVDLDPWLLGVGVSYDF